MFSCGALFDIKLIFLQTMNVCIRPSLVYPSVSMHVNNLPFSSVYLGGSLHLVDSII